MRFSRVGAIAALGSLSQAFLIPPTITSADNEHINIVPFADPVLDQQLVDIECLGCPVGIVALDGQTNSPTSGVDSMLRFNFSISHSDKDILMLNDHQIYPVDPMSQSFMRPLTADQLVKTPDGTWNYVATLKLGFSLSAEHAASSSNTEPLEIISIRLDIIEIEQVFVDKFPIIRVDLLETASGKLMIGDLLLSTPQPLSSTPAQECKSTACKWREFVAGMVSKLKGLKGSKGCGSGKKTTEIALPDGSALTHTPSKPFHGHHRPGHSGHRAHRHHRHSRFAKFLRGLVFHVFIPIMIGVVVGVTASLVGMVVGHIAIFIWRVLFRRGQSAKCHRVHEESISKNDEDAKSLLEHDNPPPEYEDSPAYEDVVSDEKA